jgi:BirA family transcriptional regulator, biotin operon repressor / biotin---[acetyl-CoA-carboxylase] ligase
VPAWLAVEVVDRALSTNALVSDRARAGQREGLVVVAEHQTAGRGRLDRAWETPARAALTFSVLLRPASVPDRWWPWLPLLAGVAVVEGVTAAGGPACDLKWPNDVMHEGSKLGGILAERVDTAAGTAAVLGIGLNVSTLRHELPVSTATSLLLSGPVAPDRNALLVALLTSLTDRYRDWTGTGGDPGQGLADTYTRLCGTVGRQVRVELPSGPSLEGRVVGVDLGGCLVVESAGRTLAVSAGDVVHVRG